MTGENRGEGHVNRLDKALDASTVLLQNHAWAAWSSSDYGAARMAIPLPTVSMPTEETDRTEEIDQ